MALKLKGSTSGFVGLDAPSVAGNNTLILPENSGSAFQIFANDITAGVTTFTTVTVNRNGDLTVPGTISIGGTLTYEDVTSVDSIGIVTARGLSIFGNTTGLNVASGISTFQAVTATTGTFTGNLTITNTAPQLLLVDTNDNDDFVVKNANGTFKIQDSTNDEDRLSINSAGNATFSNNLSAGGAEPWTVSGGNTRNISLSGSGASGRGSLNLGNGAATTNADFDLGQVNFYNGATEVARIAGGTGDSNNDTGLIDFQTKKNGASATRKMRIDKDGNIDVGSNSASEIPYVRFHANRSNADDALGGIFGRWNNNSVAAINFKAGADTSNKDDGRIQFITYTGASAATRMMILETGQITIGNNPTINSGNIFHIEAPTSYNSGETIVSIVGDNSATGARLSLQNKTSGTSGYNEILGSDAGGQSTSAIRMYNIDQGNNYGYIALATRDNSGAPPDDRLIVSKDGNVSIYGNSQGASATYGGGGANPALYIVTNTGRAVKIHNPSAGTSGIQLTNSFTQQGEDAGPHIYCSGGGMYAIQNATHISDGNATHEFYAKNGSGTNKLIQHLRAWGWSSHLSTGSLFNLNTSQDGGGSDYFVRGSKNSTTPGGGNDVFWIYEDGDMYNVNGTFSQSSDQKLKENIVDATSQWNDFKALKFRKFNFKASTGYDTHTQLGLIAQEVELVSPGLVKDRVDLQKTTDENGDVTETDTGEVTKGIKQSVLYMKGMKALQEAMARIETLEAEVSALKGS